MSRGNVRRHILEKNRNLRDQNERPTNQTLISKHLKKIYPLGLQNSNSSFSSLSFSSLSLSLSQNSNDSSLTDHSCSQLDHKISLALSLVAPRRRPAHDRREAAGAKTVQNQPCDHDHDHHSRSPGELRRCNWITKNSDQAYVTFHDECWGVPVYDDNKLFELLALSGMLMDYNWTEILKRRELFKEAFSGFDPNIVAKMGEKEINEIASNKAIMLADCRVRCIVDNAKCILKIVKDFGSLSSYMWGYVNYKAVMNRYKHPRNVPLRTPKAEAISKDLQNRGFRFVGPVIVYSFMQAAGLTIDHMVDCYRYGDCVNLAERPWRHM